jgi:hypothetical protein
MFLGDFVGLVLLTRRLTISVGRRTHVDSIGTLTDGNEVFFKIKKTTKLNKLKVCLSL